MITISKDKTKLNTAIIHNFLTNSYWAKGRTLLEVEETIKHSLCFGVYKDDEQIGFARVVTDYLVFAYLMDVFIVPEHQGKGYSKQLMKALLEDEDLKDCGAWMLKTKDAHGLYEQFDFNLVKYPKKILERIKP